jgi:predicted metal-dependent phosphoesterase TrpH
MNGVLHVHSTYSDGELTLQQLRDAYARLGYRFACLTDHAEYLDERAVARYREESERLSDDTFRFIPGLEYECPERMHILGLGTTTLIQSRDPERVIGEIEAAGGISIIAHPRTQDFGRVESLAEGATGIEAWNSKYDGRYAPRTETFAMIRRVRARHDHVRAFFGQDLHFRTQHMGLHVELLGALLDSGSVLAALRDGRFAARSGDLQLASDGSLQPSVAERFERRHRRSRRMRRVAGTTKAVLDALGVGVPAGLKAQLRRLF